VVKVEIQNVGMVQTDFREGMTVADLVLQIKHEHNFRFRGTSALQDTSQSGLVLSDTDLITDDRTYYLTAWLEKA